MCVGGGCVRACVRACVRCVCLRACGACVRACVLTPTRELWQCALNRTMFALLTTRALEYSEYWGRA